MSATRKEPAPVLQGVYQVGHIQIYPLYAKTFPENKGLSEVKFRFGKINAKAMINQQEAQKRMRARGKINAQAMINQQEAQKRLRPLAHACRVNQNQDI